MTHLVLQFLFDSEDFMMANGFWIFLAVGAIALFGIFLPIATSMEHRRKEREAFYKAEVLRRIAEAPGEGGQAAVNLLREQERIKRIKSREGLKIGGLINVAVGIGLMIFLRALLGGGGSISAGPVHAGGPGPVYLCGLIPLLIGGAMLIYIFFMAGPLE